jgi:hypothetical protein
MPRPTVVAHSQTEQKGRIFMKHYLSRIGVIVMALILVSSITLTALAHARPFHLVEHGTLAVDKEGNLVADGAGTATHLGRFTLHRTATLKPADDGSGLVDIAGHATLTAANGDLLETDINGTLNPATGHATLVYEWKGGTGRFEKASGSAIWQVDIGEGTYDAVGDGIINY